MKDDVTTTAIIIDAVNVNQVLPNKGVNGVPPRSKSLSGNSEGSCGEGFWWGPKRRGRRIPAAVTSGGESSVQEFNGYAPAGSVGLLYDHRIP